MDLLRPTTLVTWLALAALAAVPLGCGGDEDADASRSGSDIADAVIVTDQPESGVTEGEAAGGDAGAGLSSGAPSLDVLGQIDPALPSTLAEERGSCGAVDDVPTPGTLGEINRSVVCLLNAERAARGLKALKLNSRLSKGALTHSRDMVRRTFFAHASPDGKRVEDRLTASRYIRKGSGFFVGENIAWGSGALASPSAIVQAWMDSPPHRANVLQPRFKEIGIGAVPGAPEPDAADATTYTTTFGVIITPRSSRKRRR